MVDLVALCSPLVERHFAFNRCTPHPAVDIDVQRSGISAQEVDTRAADLLAIRQYGLSAVGGYGVAE